MTTSFWRGGALTCALLLFTGAPVFGQAGSLPAVRWNDNDRPAGELRAGVLSIDLEVVPAAWDYVDGEPGVEVLAFREAGGEPENPGPTIRVPLGTEIRVSVSNPLDRPLVIHGLATRRVADMDSLVVPPGVRRETRFVADAVGTYFYWGSTTGSSLQDRIHEDSQLNGALIVDPPGLTPPPDKTMILSIWFQRPPEGDDVDWQTETMTINGRAWPHTERLTYDLGDTVRWRVINLTDRGHPMHLHGFFFDVAANGDIQQDVIHWPGERVKAVTESVPPGRSADLVWVADRPGGWPFHCHISYHVVANAVPGQYPDGEARDAALLSGSHSGDPNRHVVEGMGGLMMGIYIRPPDGYVPNEPERRRLRLFVHSDSLPGERRRFGYALADKDGELPAGPVTWPGPTLVTRVGEPTSVTVINRSPEPTQVHWHGLEIESFYDGVAGVGGYPGSVTPAILPGDSFQMRITPPRAGSYMYHTHLNDIRQQSAGLYGGFVVLEEDQQWDPETDLVFLLSTGSDPEMRPLVNGTSEPAPLRLRADISYRIRLMNITLFNDGARFRLVRDGFPVFWRALGQDGADLPERQREWDLADRVIHVGQTLDFEFRPQEPGEYHLETRSYGGTLFTDQRIDVAAEETASASP